MSFNSLSIIRTPLIVIIFGLVNHQINCEPPEIHRNKLTPLPSPFDPLVDEDIKATDDLVDATDESSHSPLPTDRSDHRATDRTILLPSAPITSFDYYPQITNWCPDCCDEDEIFIKSEKKCLKRSFIADECISSDQCIVPQSTCLRNMCVCIDYFVDFSRNKCTPIHNTAIEIYKITMIFASSCLALILLIFLACILRKSYCPTDSSHSGANRSTINDLFTIYPGTSGSPNELFNSLTPAEKPPSYSETMRMINQEIGTPPPAYHNIFYTETSSSSPILTQSTSTNQQTSNIVTSNEPSSRPSQPTNCNEGSPQSTTINAQDHSYSSSTSQPPPASAPPPPIAAFNQGRVNTAFDCDS